MKLGFIGMGNMATALCRGFIASNGIKGEDILALAAELGYDLNTKDGEDAMVAHLTQWYIAKGVLQYNSKGEPVMATERYTKEDKVKYLAEHALELVAANRDALVKEFGELSDEELAEHLTVDMVESPKFHAASGSKTATTASTTGVGCQLIFTDSSICTSLKKDLGDDAPRMNRVYKVLVDEAQTAEFNNGKENIDITILPIEFKEDVAPVVRTKKAE